MIGTFRYANTYPEAISLLSIPMAGSLLRASVEWIITHRFKGIDSVGEAFAMAARQTDDGGRMVLKVSSPRSRGQRVMMVHQETTILTIGCL